MLSSPDELNVQRSYRAPPSPPIPRSDDNKDAVIQPGTLRFPYAQTAEGAPISSVFWGRSTLSETDRLQNEFERPLAPPDPRSPESEEADLPSVVRNLDLAPLPHAHRVSGCGYAGSGTADP